MSGGIFLLRGDDDLVRMTEAPYDSEDVLQELLAKFPDLLAGDQLAGSEPRRWILIDRESALPDSEDAAGRWSVDHLFLDQDAVPTLVEVKRSSDTRIRREVVGQLIDYAANAVVYWPIETLRATFDSRLAREGGDTELELAAILEPGANTEAYWGQAAANLKAGRIRLVFVADEIPRELRRVVEFLNEQMAAEVFQHLARRPPFDDIGLRREFLRRLNAVPGVSIPEDAITRRPKVSLGLLAADPRALDAFKGVLDWFCASVRSNREAARVHGGPGSPIHGS